MDDRGPRDGRRDALVLRRSARADLYDLFQDTPAVLVPRRRRLEITERTDAQGEIVTALDEAEIDTLTSSIRGLGGVEAVAVCLMFSFLNDVHEQRIGERLRAALPGLPVFLSSEILPERGGSIAWIDPGGALRVGPGSAGAEPGPACYGLGGDRPTVTDANVVLGYLSRTHLLGGRLPIDAAAAEAAVRAHVADPLGQSVMEAAAGIISVVNHGMAEALRIVSVEHGHDAREFSLAAFGGAGPVHAAALAEEIDIPEVIVPPIPGGFSALGLVATDLRRDWSHTFYSPIESIDLGALNQRLAELERAAEFMLRGAGVPEPDRAIEQAADCRYTKQAYELTVPLASGTVTRETLDALAREFHAQHLRTYGHENPNESVQMVNVRVTATGRMPRVEFHAHAQPPVATKAKAGGGAAAGGDTTARDGAATGDGTAAGGGAMSEDGVATEREVWFGEPVLCPVIGRHDLAAGPSDSGAGTPAGAGTDLGAGTGTEVGTEVDTGVDAKVDTGIGTARPGPLIVEEMDCTVVVPPGWSATLDERGFIVMTRIGRDRSD